MTGAANGIGKLIAKELGHHGATLVLWDINSDALDKTAKELKQVLMCVCMPIHVTAAEEVRSTSC